MRAAIGPSNWSSKGKGVSGERFLIGFCGVAGRFGVSAFVLGGCQLVLVHAAVTSRGHSTSTIGPAVSSPSSPEYRVMLFPIPISRYSYIPQH